MQDKTGWIDNGVEVISQNTPDCIEDGFGEG